MLRMQARRVGRASLEPIPIDDEVRRSEVRVDFLRVSQQPAVQ